MSVCPSGCRRGALDATYGLETLEHDRICVGNAKEGRDADLSKSQWRGRGLIKHMYMSAKGSIAAVVGPTCMVSCVYPQHEFSSDAVLESSTAQLNYLEVPCTPGCW